MILLVSILLIAALAATLAGIVKIRCLAPAFRQPFGARARAPDQRRSSRSKPLWVRREVLRLKALMPEHGCRKIAVVFNHLHHRQKRMTVGKSYVASVLQRHGHEVAEIRRALRRRRPRRMPKNLVWAMDLTSLPGSDGSQVMGLIDHGTRALLALRSLPDKASITLLRALLEAVEQLGKPKNLRTDNEAVFTSRLFRFGLWLLGIRHQRTAPFSPRQNGRIERLFGTLKPLWRKLLEQQTSRQGDREEDLNTFRTWYNHLRPHQSLDGLSPAEAWSGKEPSRRREPLYFEAWKGVLTGFYFPD